MPMIRDCYNCIFAGIPSTRAPCKECSPPEWRHWSQSEAYLRYHETGTDPDLNLIGTQEENSPFLGAVKTCLRYSGGYCTLHDLPCVRICDDCEVTNMSVACSVVEQQMAEERKA